MSAKESKTIGRFATAEEAARARNASLVAMLQKNPKVVTTFLKTGQVK